MAQPSPYVPNFNYQSELGTAFGTHLDAEFTDLATVIGEIETNLALIQRDDGAIRNQTVHANAFTTDALTLMAGSSVSSDLDWRPMGAWVTATLYDVGNIVENGSPATAYACAEQHTSGIFATDYADGKWVVLSAPRTLVSADVVAALGYTPVNRAGDTMTGALVAPTLTSISGMVFKDTYSLQDLVLVDQGIYSNFESAAADIIYGFASNAVRSGNSPLTVGGQFSGIAMSGVSSSVFGENSNAVALNGSTSPLIAHEADVGNFAPSNTSAKIGYNAVFKNRGDGFANPGAYSYVMPSGTYASAGAGLGTNQYNTNSIALWVVSQERTATGEFCGWTRGLHFDEYALDSEVDATYPGSRAYPIGIDFSELHYYGGTDPVTAFNLEAAIALRDFQAIWWNRDPATASSAVNKVKTYFNAAVGRWVIENNGVEAFGFDVSSGFIYSYGVLFGGASLGGNNAWTGTNDFQGAVEFDAGFAFSGSGRRILGDFSNATLANRVLVQTSTANSNTEFGLIANGSAGEGGFYVVAGSNPATANVPIGRFAASTTQVALISGLTSGSTYVPMTFFVAGSERMRIEQTVGQVLIGTTSVSAVTGVDLRVAGLIQCDDPVAFSVHRAGSSYSVANNTPTVIDFTTEVFDTNGCYSTVTDRFTPPAGKYALMGATSTAAGTAVDQGAIVVAIYKNGVQEKSGNFAAMSGTSNCGSAVSCIVDANGTDYFQLVVTQVTGAACTLTGAATDTYFQGHRIG